MANLKKISPNLQRRREKIAIDMADAQMFQAIKFQDEIGDDHVTSIYKILYEKALNGNMNAIKYYLDRVIGKEIERVESTHTDVASIMALWLQQNHEESEPVDVTIIEEEDDSEKERGEYDYQQGEAGGDAKT